MLMVVNEKGEDRQFNLYGEHGVKEYWVVHQTEALVQVFTFVKGKYQLRDNYCPPDKIPVGIFKGFEIECEAIFKE